MALVAGGASLRGRRRLDKMDRSGIFLRHGDPAVMVAGPATVIVGAASLDVCGGRGRHRLGLGGSGRDYGRLA